MSETAWRLADGKGVPLVVFILSALRSAMDPRSSIIAGSALVRVCVGTCVCTVHAHAHAHALAHPRPVHPRRRPCPCPCPIHPSVQDVWVGARSGLATQACPVQVWSGFCNFDKVLIPRSPVTIRPLPNDRHPGRTQRFVISSFLFVLGSSFFLYILVLRLFLYSSFPHHFFLYYFIILGSHPTDT